MSAVEHEGPASEPGPPASRVDRLLDELRSFGLSDVDAHRAAFCALALADGWSKARIGRYLGISRARVGQKVEKLRDYAMAGPPTLARALAVADAATPHQRHGADHLVEFRADEWDDLELARRLCDIAAR